MMVNEPKRVRHAVPLLRLPHSEPLAADRHEADLPQQEAKQQAKDGERLRPVERRGIGPQPTHERDRTDPAQHRDTASVAMMTA